MGKAVRAVAGVVAAVVGLATGQWWLVAAGAALTLSSAIKVPKVTANAATTQRLQKQLDPEAFRKIIFGETAAGADLRYFEVFGTDANSYVEVIASSTHKIESFGKFYKDDAEIPLDGSGNATGVLAGAFTRTTRTVGVSGAGIALGAHGIWTTSASLTGCSYYVLNYTYSQEKYPQGISSRYTQVIKGALVYDPRRDIAFGGTHKIDDQATWQYSPTDSNGKPIGRNNALQMLWYQLGWRINGVLVAGKGVDPADIDIDTFIQAANDCEVMGWYSDCILSTGDPHETNEGILSAASQGELLDPGGRFSYYVAVDDTANIAVDLNDGDVISDETTWVPRDQLSEFFNEIAGTYVEPASLYQPSPFPLMYDSAYYTSDGRKKRITVALSSVQDVLQAQKLMRIKLNMSRFQGEYTATFSYKAMQAQNRSIVRLTLPEEGWVNKKFRVISYGIAAMGGIDMTLKEVDASIYTGGTVVTPPAPSAGFAADPYIAIATGTVTATATGVYGGAGTAIDVIQLTYPLASPLVARTELMYKKSTDIAYTPMAIARDNNAPVIQPLQPTTTYEFKIRHISVYGVEGPWTTLTKTTNAVTVSPIGTLTYADGTPVESLKPAGPNANNTQTNTAAAITGQGDLATTNKASLPFGTNVLANTDWYKDDAGWDYFQYINSIPGVTGSGGGRNYPTIFGVRNTLFTLCSYPANAGGYYMFGPAQKGYNGGVPDIRRYGLAVVPGDRIGIRLLASIHGGTQFRLRIRYFNGAGFLITESDITPPFLGDGRYGGPSGVNGDPANMGSYSGTLTVPASAEWALAGCYAITSTDASTAIFITEPMFCKLPAGQTVIPPYAPGLTDRSADQTAEKTAAAIAGQGALATQSAVNANQINAGNVTVSLGVGSSGKVVLNGTANRLEVWD